MNRISNWSKEKVARLKGLLELMVIPLAWITFISESETSFQWFTVSSFLLAILLIAPMMGIIFESLYVHYIEKSNCWRYGKFFRAVMISGLLIGIPFAIWMETIMPFAAIYVNLISVGGLLSEYLGYLIFAAIIESYKSALYFYWADKNKL